MPMGCIRKWKRLTLTAEGQPLDFFDPGITPCPDGIRKACQRLLRNASLDQETINTIEDRIQSPELTEAEGLELVFYLQAHGKQLDEYYAPTQRMIAEHIKKICGL